MKDQNKDNKPEPLFVEGKNFNIDKNKYFFVANFKSDFGNEDRRKEIKDSNISNEKKSLNFEQSHLKPQEQGVDNRRERDRVSSEGFLNKPKQEENEKNCNKVYLFFNYLDEENKKKKNIFNPNPLNIEYTKDRSKNIESIKIPIAIWNEFQKLKVEEVKVTGAVAFGGKRAGTILSEINILKKDGQVNNALNNKVNALVESLGATDEAERIKGLKNKIVSVLAWPSKKIEEYKQSKSDAEKDKKNKTDYLEGGGKDRFAFKSYWLNGLLHCDVSYIGDKKKKDNGDEIAGENYGTSTILLEGSLKNKFLEIEKRYKGETDKEVAAKKIAQLNLLGSYFVSSGRVNATADDEDKIPQLNLENPKGKQKIKFSVSVNKDNNKVKLVSYNIDKDILAEIKAGEKAMNKIEKDFFVKLPSSEVSSEVSYVKCNISRNESGELSIEPDLTMVYNNNLFASSDEKKVKIMNESLGSCKFQIVGSVERGKVVGDQQDENHNGDAPKKTAYKKVLNDNNPETEIKLTGENLLDKLSKGASKNNSQQ